MSLTIRMDDRGGDVVEPISLALLVALAGGAGGEAGKQAWSGLSALVRRPFHRGDGTPSVSSGEAELVALERAPALEQANALSAVLAVRAALDPQFRDGLEQWHQHARVIRTGDGETSTTFNGGTFNGPVLNGRDFSGINFSTPPTLPSAPTGTAAPQD
ncbi:hypothetical protein ACWGQ5_53985 [Streptomyces sp. NPDC055722]